MTPPLLRHPLWPELKPYLRAEAAGEGERHRRRYRIEVERLPVVLLPEALALKVPCCACGRRIHPIRKRRPPGNKRSRRQSAAGLYYAAACPLAQCVGCSRGIEAKANYAAMAAALLGAQ